MKKGNTISKNKKSPKTIPQRILKSLLVCAVPAVFMGVLSQAFLPATAAWLLAFEALYFIGIVISSFAKKNGLRINKAYGLIGLATCLILLFILLNVSPIDSLYNFKPFLDKHGRYAPGMPF